MILESLFNAVQSYYPVKNNTIAGLEKLVRLRTIPANTQYLSVGEVPVFVSYIYKGLFSYSYQLGNGDAVIKKFFPENTFIASTSALASQAASKYAIEALENSWVAELNFKEFKHLMHGHPDLAFFWINYLEKNWVIAKEDKESTDKYLTAQTRYQLFLEKEPHIAVRLQQQQIASYLGITPTQLSRIKKALLKK